MNRYELAQIFCEANDKDSGLLVPITRQETAKMPRNINLKPSKKFLEMQRIPLQEGIKHNIKELGAYNAS